MTEVGGRSFRGLQCIRCGTPAPMERFDRVLGRYVLYNFEPTPRRLTEALLPKGQSFDYLVVGQSQASTLIGVAGELRWALPVWRLQESVRIEAMVPGCSAASVELQINGADRGHPFTPEAKRARAVRPAHPAARHILEPDDGDIVPTHLLEPGCSDNGAHPVRVGEHDAGAPRGKIAICLLHKLPAWRRPHALHMIGLVLLGCADVEHIERAPITLGAPCCKSRGTDAGNVHTARDALD